MSCRGCGSPQKPNVPAQPTGQRPGTAPRPPSNNTPQSQRDAIIGGMKYVPTK